MKEILIILLGLLMVYSIFQFFIACLFYSFGIKIPMKDKPPIYEMRIRNYRAYYSIEKLEYKYKNLVGGKYALLWFLLPFSPLFRVKRYSFSDTTFGSFTEKDINNLSDDFCFGEYYEREYEKLEKHISESSEREDKLKQKIKRLNNNKC